MHTQILSRIQGNVALLANASARLLPVAAGWSAVLQLRQRATSETMAVRLIHEAGIIVHPGSFYGIPGGSHLVVSLITPAGNCAAGVHQLNKWCESNQLT